MSEYGMLENGTTETYTVDELARTAGTMTTTVRMYQARGLLTAPTKRGRVAVYDNTHLARLRLIANLQRRGHSLAGIKELLDNSDSGTAVADLLGMRGLAAPTTLTLSPADFAARFASAAVTADDMRRAVELGLVRLNDDMVEVDERFLRAGAELIALGVPVAAVLDEWSALLSSTEQIAARFTRIFEKQLWPLLDARSASLSEIAAVLDQLAPLAQQVTALALDAALREAADRFAREHLG